MNLINPLLSIGNQYNFSTPPAYTPEKRVSGKIKNGICFDWVKKRTEQKENIKKEGVHIRGKYKQAPLLWKDEIQGKKKTNNSKTKDG